MEILYLSSLSSRKLIDSVKKKTGNDPGYAVQKFNRLVVQGLKNNGAKVFIYSKPPVNKTAGRNWVSIPTENEDGLTYNYAKYFNIPVLKDLCVCISTFFKVFKFGLRNKKDKALVCDILAISMNLGAVLAAKLVGLRITGIVTDMPGMMVDLSNNKRSSISKSIVNKINLSYISSYTHYVFLTEQMNNIINKKKKPYIVVEALCDSSLSKVHVTSVGKTSPRIVMYAGGLDEKYGLKLLVDGFRCLKKNDINLVIYGSGPYAKELSQVVKEDSRVLYRGVASNEEVLQAELEATLLVNPRPTTEEFTKYSFPSKNMEYMASGTPLLTTKLPGMPKDYYPYVYLFEEESVDGYTVSLKKILDLPAEELEIKGEKAKRYVLENKNNVVQSGRILNLIFQE